MLSQAQQDRIASLHHRRGREESGLCLVEGEKVVAMAGDYLVRRFTADDVPDFRKLVTTEAPQDVAAIARIPEHSHEALLSAPTLLVLDGVQDPGNVGAVLRLALGFGAAVLLVESADATAPKVVRASAGAFFAVPWRAALRAPTQEWLAALGRPVFRLEGARHGGAAPTLSRFGASAPCVLIAGSEGRGILLHTPGESLALSHDPALESLNVGHAIAIALHARYTACRS
jgi:TrmH family RNA methyltransferase